MNNIKINLNNLTIIELKELCKIYNIKGYSTLNKNKLIKLLKKNTKSEGIFNKFKKKCKNNIIKKIFRKSKKLNKNSGLNTYKIKNKKIKFSHIVDYINECKDLNYDNLILSYEKNNEKIFLYPNKNMNFIYEHGIHNMIISNITNYNNNYIIYI